MSNQWATLKLRDLVETHQQYCKACKVYTSYIANCPDTKALLLKNFPRSNYFWSTCRLLDEDGQPLRRARARKNNFAGFTVSKLSLQQHLLLEDLHSKHLLFLSPEQSAAFRVLARTNQEFQDRRDEEKEKISNSSYKAMRDLVKEISDDLESSRKIFLTMENMMLSMTRVNKQ